MQQQNSAVKTVNWRGWIVCLATALFFFYIFVIMTMFNAIDASLMTAFSIQAGKLGWLSSAFFWSNAILVFPAGLLLDRYSTKRMVIISMFICAITMGLFSITTSFGAAFVYRVLMGVGGAFALVSCLRMASRWFAPQKLALISGSMITLGFLGGLVSQTPLTMLVAKIGWRHSMQVVALVGVVIIVLIWLIVRDVPKGQKLELSTEDAASAIKHMWKSIKNAVSHYQNWLFGIYTSLVNLPIFILGAVWGGMFLHQSRHFTLQHASYITSMLFLGAMFGSPIFGLISDKMQSRKIPMMLGALISLIITLVIMYVVDLSLIEQVVMFFLLGFITSSQVLSYPAIAESNPPEYVGGALGIGSMLIMFGGVVPSLFGWIMSLNWNHLMIHRIAIYSNATYMKAMWILPIAFVVSLIIAFVVKETFHKTKAKK